MALVWAVRRCKRCGAPLVAEKYEAQKWHRVYKTYAEAEAKEPRAGRVLVETLPQVPIDESAPCFEELRYFKTLPTCPKYPGKKCED